MNSILNSIFDQDSLDAIKNAQEISPSPEYFQRNDYKVSYTEVVEEKAEPEDKEEKKENAEKYNKQIQDLQKSNRDLQIKLETQRELISKIVKSQNEMIKELNKLQTKPDEDDEEDNDEKPEEESPKQNKENQQTSNCNGLDQNDYCVENLFYFGK